MTKPVPKRFDHSFTSDVIKYSITGIIVGFLGAVVKTVVESKGKVINKWWLQLKREGIQTEALDEEREICKVFALLYQQYVKSDARLRPFFDAALEDASDLAFLAKTLEEGELNNSIEDVAKGNLDPVKDLDYEKLAYQLLINSIDNVTSIQNLLFHKDKPRILDQNKREELYTAALEQFEQRKRDAEKKRLELEIKLDECTDYKARKQMQEELKVLASVKNEAAPEKPVDLNMKFKSDMVNKYKILLQGRLQRLCMYINDLMEDFRKKNPGKNKKVDLYGISKKGEMSFPKDEEEEEEETESEWESETEWESEDESEDEYETETDEESE